MTQTQLRTATEERLQTTGGLSLFVRSWRPEGGARGVVVIVPGFNSHSGYYGWAAEQLVAADLLNDLDREVVMADVKSWIVGHLRG